MVVVRQIHPRDLPLVSQTILCDREWALLDLTRNQWLLSLQLLADVLDVSFASRLLPAIACHTKRKPLTSREIATALLQRRACLERHRSEVPTVVSDLAVGIRCRTVQSNVDVTTEKAQRPKFIDAVSLDQTCSYGLFSHCQALAG